MVNVNLYDTLTIEPADEIVLTCNDPELPTDDRNLVVKAAKVLASASGYRGGVRIHLEKNIPSGGGMGGGSSDAACTLSALNKLWGLNLDLDKLHQLASELGSDVAFFLYGGWRRCRGRGEIVEPLKGSETWPPIGLALILPPFKVSTAEVYKKLIIYNISSKKNLRTLTEVTENVYNTICGRTNNKVGLLNDLTEAARTVEPRLIALQELLGRKFPGHWLMSGSGAAHFVVGEWLETDFQLREVLATEMSPGLRLLTLTTFTP